MISTLLLAIALGTQTPAAALKVIEVPDATATTIHLTVFVKAPHLKEKEATVFRVMMMSLLEGTEEYDKQELYSYGGQAGPIPQVTLSRDFAQMELALPASGADLLFQLAESILVRPSFSEEGVEAAKAQLVRRRPTLVALSLEPFVWSTEKVTVSDVRLSFKRFVRPDNVVFALGGALNEGTRAMLLERFAGWNPGPRPKPPKFDRNLNQVNESDFPVSVFEFSGHALTPATPFSGAQILATYALGAGKDCTLWKVIREEHKWAYRTEGILWPTAEGWVPRFFIFRKTSPQDDGFPSLARDAMLKDIQTWNAETLVRAQVLARASLTRDFGLSPLWLSAEGPKNTTLHDRMSWRGYLEMIGSGALDEKTLAAAMDEVDLETLKSQATAMVTLANASYIRGKS